MRTYAAVSYTHLDVYKRQEHVIRVGVYGKRGALSLFHTAYVRFVHVGHNLHLRQVGSDGEQCRCCLLYTSRCV